MVRRLLCLHFSSCLRCGVPARPCCVVQRFAVRNRSATVTWVFSFMRLRVARPPRSPTSLPSAEPALAPANSRVPVSPTSPPSAEPARAPSTSSVPPPACWPPKAQPARAPATAGPSTDVAAYPWHQARAVLHGLTGMQVECVEPVKLLMFHVGLNWPRATVLRMSHWRSVGRGPASITCPRAMWTSS